MTHRPTHTYRTILRFFSCKKGLAAVELSLILPVFLLLLIGGIEVTRYILFLQKVQQETSVLADFVSQQDTACNTKITNALTTTADNLSPFSHFISRPKLRVSSLIPPAEGGPFCHSQARNFCTTWTIRRTTNGGADAVQFPLDEEPLPGDFSIPAGESYIGLEIATTYTPMLSITENFLGIFTSGGSFNYKEIRTINLIKPRNNDLRRKDNNC